MYFLFYAQAFDDVMKSQNLKPYNLNFSRRKRRKEKGVLKRNKKHFDKCSRLDLKKRTNKNAADTTFKQRILWMQFAFWGMKNILRKHFIQTYNRIPLSPANRYNLNDQMKRLHCSQTYFNTYFENLLENKTL